MDTGKQPIPAPAGQDEAAVGALLARANLLRLRHQWDDAIAACTDVLRQAPDSPTAHSLLGDIYESQGRLEDALQWYAMAVDLNPSNSADRAKLNRIVEQQRAAIATVPESGKPLLHQSAKPSAERTIEWFDRYFPPGRSEGIARLIFAMSCAIALVLVIAAGFFFAEHSDSRSTAVNIPPAVRPAVGGSSTSAPAPAAAPDTGTTATGASDTSPAGAIATNATGRGKGMTATVTTGNGVAAAGMVAQPNDSGLFAALYHGLPSGLLVRRASIDPHAENAQITVEIAASAVITTDPAGSRERVLRAAAVAANVAARAESRLRRLTVQIILPGGNVLFTGETTGVVRDHDPGMETAAGIASLFTNIQWSAGLMENNTDNNAGNKRN